MSTPKELDELSLDDHDKAEAVYYALNGKGIPFDATGRIIREGDWVVQAVTMGKVAGLRFSRAFPIINDQGKVKVTCVGITTDNLSYDRGEIIEGTVEYTFRLFIINKEQVPKAIQKRLDFPLQELRDAKNKKRAALKAKQAYCNKAYQAVMDTFRQRNKHLSDEARTVAQEAYKKAAEEWDRQHP